MVRQVGGGHVDPVYPVGNKAPYLEHVVGPVHDAHGVEQVEELGGEDGEEEGVALVEEAVERGVVRVGVQPHPEPSSPFIQHWEGGGGVNS